jgi:hypothetical protein
MPDGGARDPDWPLLMDAGTAARYLRYTRAQMKALILAGFVPPPREHLPGLPRWHREELDACMARLWNLRREDQDAEERGRALEAKIARFDPAAARRAQAGERRGIPLLPARRRVPPAPGA